LCAAHEAQLLPPATVWLPPLLPLLTAEKREKTRDVRSLPHWLQAAGESALPMGRSFPNLAPQSAH